MKHFRTYFLKINSESGVTLVFIIIAMVVVALLGVGLYTLTMTSALNQVEAQKSAKAYYLAESGIRVAAGEYANSANKNQTLLGLQGKTFTLDDASEFSLQIRPYWFYVNTNYNFRATPIVIYYPGKLPKVNIDGTDTVTIAYPGVLKLKGFTRVGVFESAPTIGTMTASGTPIEFNISTHSPCTSPLTTPCPGFPYAITSGSDLFIGYVYNTTQAINQGSDLVFNDPNHTAAMYPPVNGTIIITPPDQIGRPGQYTYERRIPQAIDPASPPASFTLQNIQPATSDSNFPIRFIYDGSNLYNVTKTTQVYLGKTLAIESTAVYGN